MFFVVVLFSPLVSSEELAIWLLVSFSPGAKDTFFAFDGLVSGVVIGCGLVVVWTYSCSTALIVLIADDNPPSVSAFTPASF